jgi:hypothetical protein
MAQHSLRRALQRTSALLAFIALEANATARDAVWAAVRPVLDSIMDGRARATR